MFKVTIVYISNVPVKLFMDSDVLTAKEKKALLTVTANATKKGDIVDKIMRTHEFNGKKVSHTVCFKDQAAYMRYIDAQEKAVPGYITKRAAWYESQHVAVNEKSVTE